MASNKIEFINTDGEVYGFFLPKLDEKYYKSTPKFDNIFENDKKIDSLAVGNSFNAFISNKWSVGDVNISLRWDYEITKTSDKKVKRRNDVILHYWSEYYYNQKQDEKANKGKKKTSEAQNDL